MSIVFCFVLLFCTNVVCTLPITFEYPMHLLEMLHNYKFIDTRKYIIHTLRIVVCYYSASVSVSAPLVILLTSGPSCPVVTTQPRPSVAAAPVSDV